MKTRFGKQPALAVMRQERWTVAEASRKLEISYQHLSRCLSGALIPSDRVKIALAGLLGRPPEVLFSVEALDAARRRDEAIDAAARRSP